MGLLQRACARNTAGVSNARGARTYTHIYTWRREPLIFQAFSRARPFSKVSASLTRGHPAWLMPLLILKRESRQQCRDSRLLCVCVCVCVRCEGPLALLRQELAVSLAVLLSFSPSFSPPPPIFLLNYADVSRVSIASRSRYSPPLEIHNKNKIALFFA